MGAHKTVSGVKHCRGFTLREMLVFLVVFIITVGCAIMLTAPKNYVNKQTELVNAEKNIRIENQSAKNLQEQTLPKESAGLLARLIGSSQSDKPVRMHGDNATELNAEQRQFLTDSYQELYKSTSNSSQDKHLPSISGRVLNQSGGALSGISVSAVRRDYVNGGNKNLMTLPRVTTVTNGSGFFGFTGLENGVYLLKTHSKGYLSNSIEVRSGVKYADIVLERLSSLSVSGQVFDADTGQAIPGVNLTPLVKGSPESNESDPEGGFSLKFSVGDTTNVLLRLRKDGYKDLRHTIDVDDIDGLKGLRLEMERSSANGALFGTISSNANEPLDGLLIELYSPSVSVNYKTRTDDSGDYYFANIEEAEDYQIWVRPSSEYQDYTRKRLRISSQAGKFDIKLESLEQGYELSGQVVDLENNPVRNITLALRSVNARNHVVPVTTDDHGNYYVDNLPGGAIIVETSSVPYYTLSGLTLSGDNKSSFQQLIVDSGQQKLLGQVVDESGEPVRAPSISITSSQDINGMRSQASRSTSSDEKGNFLFTDLGAQHYTITVNAPGFKGTRFRHQLGQQVPLIVRLRKKSI